MIPTTKSSFLTSLITKLSSIAPVTPPLHPSTPSSPSPSSPPSPHSTFFSTTLPSQTHTRSQIQSLLTTLHFLFPHELIPALDLLDRQLVTRQVVVVAGRDSTCDADGRGVDGESARAEGEEEEEEVFYVQSTSTSTSTAAIRSTSHRRVAGGGGGGVGGGELTSNIHYEVRLPSWNCTCPAFAISTVSTISTLPTVSAGGAPSNGHLGGGEEEKGSERWRFGGMLTILTDSECWEGGEVRVPVCKHILAAVLGKRVPGLFGKGVVLREVSVEEAAGWAGMS